MAQCILLVEDDTELGLQVVDRLRRQGFAVIWWQVGRTIAPADLDGVSLVILDLMLPGVYGMDMLKEIRSCSEVPVMVLSARNDSADKVRALQLGADDYMIKPFWPEELLERVRARLRRPALVRGERMEIGPLTIDLRAHEVQMDGRQVDLTRVEFDFLRALAMRPGAAITRRWLTENVLDPERDGNERTLDVHVSRLRKKLGPTQIIETVWGIGYRLHAGREA